MRRARRSRTVLKAKLRKARSSTWASDLVAAIDAANLSRECLSGVLAILRQISLGNLNCSDIYGAIRQYASVEDRIFALSGRISCPQGHLLSVVTP